jgi:LysR family transcriptional regulator of beta-lactamase
LDLTVADKRLNLALAVNFSNGRDHDAQLSPLNSLRAFEAAARHLSFTHAAIELNVTHSAISQHVKALEQHLNCQLFVRVSRGLMLTTEGENLLPVLNDSFDRIAGMLDRFASQRAQEKLKIGVVGPLLRVFYSRCSRTFAAAIRILIFSFPRITIASIRRPKGLITPFATVAGVARHRCEFLCPAPLAPLCTPDIASGCPADILKFTLLRSYRRDEWSAWMQARVNTSLTDAPGDGI